MRCLVNGSKDLNWEEPCVLIHVRYMVVTRVQFDKIVPSFSIDSTETMIDTRPGTSTVGIQCSIWEQPPEQVLPSIPLNKATEVHSSSRSSSAVGGEIVLQCRNIRQNDQLVKQYV